MRIKMKLKRLVLRFCIFSVGGFILLIFYFEFGRNIRIDPLEFTQNVYEKDFIDRSFSLVNDFPTCRFVKTIEVNVNERNITIQVEAVFSQEQGWPVSYCHLISFGTESRDHLETIIKELKAKYGSPTEHNSTESDVFGNTREISDRHWVVDGADLVIPSENHMKEFEAGGVTWMGTRPSLPFLAYIIAKKWMISKLPNSLQPDWSKEISQARINAE